MVKMSTFYAAWLVVWQAIRKQHESTETSFGLCGADAGGNIKTGPEKIRPQTKKAYFLGVIQPSHFNRCLKYRIAQLSRKYALSRIRRWRIATVPPPCRGLN
jgi:hypothetical protein